MRKLYSVVIALLLLAFCLSGAFAEDDTIKIGVIECLTGENAAIGAWNLAGATLGNEMRNTVNVGGKDYKVEFEVLDCKTDKVEAANCATRLVEDNVTAIIGPTASGYNMAINDIVEAAKIPTIASSVTSPLVTLGKDYYWRCCFTNDFFSVMMANYAYSMGLRKVALVQEITQDASYDIGNQFKQLFTDLGGEIVVEVFYNVQDQDYNAQLVSMSQYELDGVFAPGTGVNIAMMIQQAEALGLTDWKWVGIDSIEVPEFIEIGGDAVKKHNVYFGTMFDSKIDTPATRVLSEAFDTKYPGENLSAVVALNYDAYNILLDAIESAQSFDGTAINDAIRAIENFEGASGYITFDANHNVETHGVIKTINEDGQFEFVTVYERD